MRYLMITVVFAIGCSKPAPTLSTKVDRPTIVEEKKQPIETKPEKKIYTQEELRGLIQGKTQEEVAAIIGKPKKTGEEPVDNSMMIVWDYHEIAKDQFATDPSKVTRVWFSFNKDGKFKVYNITHN